MKDRMIQVLLIEDDPDDVIFLAEMMAQSSWPTFRFTLEVAEDLKKGLEILGRGETEAVLLDLMLPDSQGLETLQKLRARYPGVPVIVLTGLLDEALGLESVMRGAQDYQIKGSIEGRALKRTISYAVERHRMTTQFLNIIQSAADGMVVVDGRGLVRYVNPAAERFFDWRAEAVLGKPFPYPLTRKEGEIKMAVGGGPERVAELRVTDIDWEDEPAKLATVRDITELRRVEELKAAVKESKRVDKLKDELVSAVSHTMRSSLAIIKAAGENLKEGFAGPMSDQQNELVALQFRNILRLEKVVERILDLSRLESGKAEIRPQRVNAAQLIRETARSYALLSGERRVGIEQEAAPGVPPAYADPELFIQVLSNLLDNALRYAKARVLVRAAAHEEGGRRFVRVSVCDDGPGVPQERLGELFDKFVQVRRSSKGAGYKGTGLGLAIAKEIVERLGGRIWAESAPGEGARFHFLLPEYDPALAGKQGRAYAQKP